MKRSPFLLLAAFVFLAARPPVYPGRAPFFSAPGISPARPAAPSAPPAANVALQPPTAYADTTLRGSAAFSDPDGDPEGASTYRWLVNGGPAASGLVPQTLLLPLDGSLPGTDGEPPLQAQGLVFEPGRFGQAVTTRAAEDSRLAYAAAGNVDPGEGTLELWVRPAYDLDDPAYDTYPRLFSYVIDAEHQLYVEVNQDRLILTSRNAGAYYGTWPDPPGWQAGEWHHLAVTWSAAADRLAVYYDCDLAADSEFPALAGQADRFYLGSAADWGVLEAAFDDVRLSRRALSAAEIAASCARYAPAPNDEVLLLPGQAGPGDTVTFELTPCDAAGACGTPASASVTVAAPPLGPLAPAPGLLPAGTLTATLSLTTTQPAGCRWGEQPNTPYAAMPYSFAEGQGITTHRTTVSGLRDLDDRRFYVRCADTSGGRDPDDYERATHLRVLNAVSPPFPRTGNLWGWWELAGKGLPYLARQDLLLGADGISAAEIAELRRLNPHIRVLTSINAVENGGLPDDYYLKDVDGNRIEVWPGSYRLNLTKLYVAEYQAHYAYQTLLDTGLQADGVFFDNVFTSQSWYTHDIYGNEIQIDADEDGLPDAPAAFDAAWKAGVFHELDTFRALAPHAITNGHAMDVYEPGIAERFNGISLGFWTADVLEGERSFGELWSLYHDWLARAKDPPVTMFESSPLDEIAYGYDYSPWDGKIPASTLAFARDYHPWMRFGLALTLMGDGYFAHEYGDTWHGNDWWYDELDFNLGYPLGPAQRVDLGTPPPVNQVENGGFETPIAYPWDLWANAETGCAAAVTRDTTTAAAGAAAARIDITATSGVDWHVDFAQFERVLQAGQAYDVTFWAKSDRPRPITLSAQKGSPEWDNYGLWQTVALDTSWQPFTVTFQAAADTSEARLQFLLGAATGAVWLDEVRLSEHPPDVYRRAFDNGLVLLNGTREAQTVELDPGYRRLVGQQAARYETILDDGGPGFSTTGSWASCSYDSGEWQAGGPFYHDWGTGCRLGTDSEARWELPITAADTYTLTAWWPAAPEAAGWNAAAAYQVVAGGQVVASVTLDQRTGGDEWHLIGAVALAPGDGAYVRLLCSGGAPCLADALHLRSAARYNDGTPAGQVTLAPLDGIVLQREWAPALFLPLVLR